MAKKKTKDAKYTKLTADAMILAKNLYEYGTDKGLVEPSDLRLTIQARQVEAKKLIANGVSQRVAAKLLGVSKSTVQAAVGKRPESGQEKTTETRRGKTDDQNKTNSVPLSQFQRTDGHVKSACEFNGEDPADVAEPGDSEQTIRHRIFVHHASEAVRHAHDNGFDRAAPTEITEELIAMSLQAAEAWSALANKLQQRMKKEGNRHAA